jgi:5'-3' exonuclease
MQDEYEIDLDESPTDLGNKEGLVLVDASNVFHRGLHAQKGLTTSRGLPVDGLYGFQRLAYSILKEHRGARVIFVWDGGSVRRKAILPSYKENRRKYDDHGVPLFKEEEDKAVLEQLKGSRKLLTASGVPQLWISGVEADDVIAHLARTNPGSLLCSGDKDYYQLLQVPGTRLDRGHFAKEGEVLTKERFTALHTITPLQYRLCHCILGDPGDDVPKAAPDSRIGEKKARDFARNIPDSYLGDEPNWDYIVSCASSVGGHGFKMLAEAKAELIRNFLLVDLLHLDLLDDTQLEQVKHQLTAPWALNENHLDSLWRDFEFNSLVQDRGEYIYQMGRIRRDVKDVKV